MGWVLGKTVQSPMTDHTDYRVRLASDMAAVRYETGLARSRADCIDDVADRAYLDGVIGALSWTTGDVAELYC